MAGVLPALCFPKFNLFPLSAIALAPLLLVTICESAAGRRFLWGWLAGSVFFAGTCYWIYGVMRDFGELGIPAAAGVFLLFFLVLGLYWGIFAWLAGPLWKASWGPFAVPFLWVALELARAYVISGFPWLLVGYTLTDYFPVARLSRWTGVYGLSYLVVAVNAGCVWLWLRRSKPAVIHLTVVLAALVALAATSPEESYRAEQKAFLVQTQIPQDVAFERWDLYTQAPLLARLRSLTLETVGRQETPALVIWPEMPAPFYFNDDLFTREFAEGIAQQMHSYFLMGIVAFVPGSERTQPLNSHVLLDPDGRLVSQYDKIHLVPFGEYVPLRRLLGFAGKLTAEVGDFVPGSRYVVSSLPGGRMSAVICYEAIFPDLVRRFVREGAEVLVNISNDGWYGSSGARYQHLLMARMRAIENARYLLRATNTGITAVIRPDGRIAAEIPPDQAAVLEGSWDFQQRQTFYSLNGDWFAIGACLISLMAGVAAWRGSRTSNE